MDEIKTMTKQPEKSELELLCEELWKHREMALGDEIQKEKIRQIKNRAESYSGVENNQNYDRYVHYVALRIEGHSARHATRYVGGEVH